MELSELLNTDTVKLTIIPAILVLLVLFFWFKRSGKKRKKNREFGRAPNSRHDNLDWATAVAEADQDVRVGQAYELDVLGDEVVAVDDDKFNKKSEFDSIISDIDDDTLLNRPAMTANRDADINFLDEVELVLKQSKTQNETSSSTSQGVNDAHTGGSVEASSSSHPTNQEKLADDIVYSYDEGDAVTPQADNLVTAESSAEQLPASEGDVGTSDAQTTATQAESANDGLLLVLNVIGSEGRPLRGAAILKALTATGVTYGEMNIFHYYHPQRPGRPLFSIANMVEPGVFTLANMDELNTPGLTLFANVARPEDGVNTFTIMLETAKKLAELLNGTVCDERRGTLSKQGIEHIHGQIREHQRRSRLVHAARA